MVRIPTHREPTHPGVLLQNQFLAELGVKPQELADAIFVPRQEIDELVNQRGRITAPLALRLSKYIGNSAQFWLNLQRSWDLYHAQRTEAADLARIKPVVWEDIPDEAEFDAVAPPDGVAAA